MDRTVDPRPVARHADIMGQPCMPIAIFAVYKYDVSGIGIIICIAFPYAKYVGILLYFVHICIQIYIYVFVCVCA